MNISVKFEQWPERAKIAVRLHLYGDSPMERCNLNKLETVFKLAKEFGIQERISTNLNQANAVYLHLDNYVLRHRDNRSCRPGGWGNHWGFLLALIVAFPGNVYVDPPEGTADEIQGTRFALDQDGKIPYEIQTLDDMA